MSKKDKANPLKGIIFGLIAGGLASALMDIYWMVVRNTLGERPEQKPKGKGGKRQDNKPSTQVIADVVSKAATGHEVPEAHKEEAGVAAHYATGILCGALFGGFAVANTKLGLAAGLLYGAAIWLFIDEIGLRALGIAPEGNEVPASEHVQALGAHFVYGAGTAFITRLLLKLTGSK